MNSKFFPLTACVHAGIQTPDASGGMVPPIHTSSSFRFQMDQGGIRYPRRFNTPTQQVAAAKVAALEGAEEAMVTGSGMAAITSTFLTFLSAGDHAVVHADVYGGTHHFVTSDLPRLGIDYTLAPSGSVENFAEAVRPNTRLIYFETPTNPLLSVVDIQAMADLGRGRGILTILDNTFATPINQRPLPMGIDVVIHSGTKYLGGHSDLCAGVVASSSELLSRIRRTASGLGGVLGPQECALLERSLKTLALRVRQHNLNGQAVAEFLAGHPRVTQVYYPGLPDHPGHETAQKQMEGFGGMVSVELDGDFDSALKFVEKLKIFSHAISLGGVESLVCFPSLTSHDKMTRDQRVRVGITDTLIRLSTGVEDPRDLVSDLNQALG